MAIKTFILGVLNIKYMHIVFRPSIVDYIVKSRAGGMWGGHLNVPVDLYLIPNYYIELRIFFNRKKNQLQHDRTRFLEMKISFSPSSLYIEFLSYVSNL